MRRAKILATLGPATNTQEKIEQLINAGLNAVRINMSHGTQDEHDETIRMARAAAKNLDMPLAVLVDLSGPKIRTGKLKGGTAVFLETGARFVITSRDVEGTAEEVSTNYKELPKLVETGARVLLDDGAIELVLELPAHPDTPLRLTQTLRVGRSLRQSLTTRNTGNRVQRFTCALHSYFLVSDASQVRVRGLDGLRYVDKFDGATHDQVGDWDLCDPRDPGRCDRVYADTGTRFEMIDADAKRTITLTTSGSRSLVIWNPGALGAAAMDDVGSAQWPRFVCLEAANAGTDIISIAPGREYVLGQEVELSAAVSESDAEHAA